MDLKNLKKRAEAQHRFRTGEGRCDQCTEVLAPLIGLGKIHPDKKGGWGSGRLLVCPKCAQRLMALLIDLFRDDLREDLATVAHEMWSGWMEYMLRVIVDHDEGRDSTRVKEVIERWQRQMETLYADLPSNEQESDREQADKMLAALPGVEEEVTELGETEWIGDRVFTSARLKTNVRHDMVTLWNRGANAGEVVLDQGDGVEYLQALGMKMKGPDDG